VEDVGERFELGRRPDLGQVARDDKVVGPRPDGGAQGSFELASPRSRVDRAPDAYEADGEVLQDGGDWASLEHVDVGQVCDATHNLTRPQERRSGRLACVLEASLDHGDPFGSKKETSRVVASARVERSVIDPTPRERARAPRPRESEAAAPGPHTPVRTVAAH
jgi:hypothetical protein